MARPTTLRLVDIRDGIFLARKAVGGLSLDEFGSDDVRRAAAERAILIISEACRFLPEELTVKYSHIRWADIRGIGNQVRHEYFRLDDETVWSVVTKHLDELLEVVEQELSSQQL